MPLQRPSGPPTADFVRAITFYRELGFFSAFGKACDTAVAAKVLGVHRAEWDVDLVPGDPYDEIVLLSYDGKRSWFEDTECDVCRENLVYQGVLADWAHVARGTFHPEAITETWESEKGPIRVRFQEGGQTHELAPAYHDDWPDLGILAPLNAILAPRGQQLCHTQLDQYALVVALAPDERTRIAKERGLTFA